MEKHVPALLDSPLIKSNTPIKRLGLSRKRKSFVSPCRSDNKIRVVDNTCTSLPVLKKADDAGTSDNLKISEKNADECVDYKMESAAIQSRIEDKQKELKALQNNACKIVELENLTETWKNGCKKAFLLLCDILKHKQVENLNISNVLKSLGISKIIVDTFESDSEITQFL